MTNQTTNVSVNHLQKDIPDIPRTGKLAFPLTNDYMFRASIQSNNLAAKGLIGALLGIEPDSITELTVENPIILGDKIEDKDCILDIRLLLDNRTNINLEMQVGNLTNWVNRSIYYLSRMHTDLKSGQNYNATRPSIQIGILIGSLFEDEQRFYSKNYLSDIETHHIYSGNFGVHVLDLSQIDNIPESEKDTPLYYWARMLLATTWEEVETMAEKSSELQSLSCTLKELSEDEKVKLRCEARERYYADREAAVNGGIQIGFEKGTETGLTNALKLSRLLIEHGRINDIERCETDKDFRQQILKEFHLL